MAHNQIPRLLVPRLLAIAAFGVFVAGCDPAPDADPIADDAPIVQGAVDDDMMEARSERLEEVAEDTDDYIGRTMTLTGEIEDVMGPRAFKLGEPGALDSDDITVFTARPVVPAEGRDAMKPWVPDDRASVTGTIRRVTVAEIEREFGFDLDPEFEVDFENRVVMVADKVDLNPAATP